MDVDVVSNGKREGALPGKTHFKPSLHLYYKYCHKCFGNWDDHHCSCHHHCCRQLGSLNKVQDRREITIQRADDKGFVKSLQDQVQNWMQVRYSRTWHQA